MLGVDERAANLSGDFAFAHHGRIQAGAHGEKVLADLAACARIERAGDQLLVEPGAFADLGDEGGPCRFHVIRMGRFAIDFEAVAGGKHHRTLHCRRPGECGCSQLGSTGAQLSNGLEVDVGVCSHQ
ncbi:hypothetical protein D9M72_481460 [compost metagenome]